MTDSPPASAPGKGPVYLAVVSEPGARRNIETAAPSAVEVTGRQVILTLKPEDAADFGETVTLSYYPDNATAASKVRDLGDNLADAFVGLRVDNDTPEGNTVQRLRRHRPREDLQDRRHDRDRSDLRGSGGP